MTEEPSSKPEVERTVRLEVDADRRLNYAMHQCAVPLIKQLRLEHVSGAPLGEGVLRVWVERDISLLVECPVAAMDPGGSALWSPFDLALNAETLASTTERELTTLHVEYCVGDEVVVAHQQPVEVLAFHEWGGLGTLPEMLAAFVLPNTPAVEKALGLASDHLKAVSDDAALSGYLYGDEGRVRSIVKAIYVALAAMQLRYVTPSASYESAGQKIRIPEQIVERRLATCLDLALFAAAMAEQAGLRAMVLLSETHAWVGAWSRDVSSGATVWDDAARLRKAVELGSLFLFETTLVTHTPAPTFADAQEAALRELHKDGPVWAIDVAEARKHRILPLPIRVKDGVQLTSAATTASESAETQDGVTVVGSDHDASDELTLDLDAPIGLAPEPDVASTEPKGRLDGWKRRLLDLSLRNRLISFRPTKRTLSLLVPDLPRLEDALASGREFALAPKPDLGVDAKAQRDADVHRARAQEDLVESYLQDELKDGRIHAPFADEEFTQRLVHLHRAARNDLQETGANTLFLALGFLEWFESSAHDTPRRAPLVLLPLELVRKSARAGFRVRAADDDPQFNVTLLEKLRVDFEVDVKGLDPLPEDDHGIDLPAIFQAVRRAIASIDRWDVKEEAALGLFSFTKFLMWKDLEDHADRLLESPVVRHLVERPREPYGAGATFPDAGTLDVERSPRDTLCPLDADSSQLAAVYAAMDGRSFVLQGPPGTGKSQTITNLIAQALGHGKRVLFVAEKSAALNVVKRRLDRVGLGEACLEIHSNKASKREVLAQLGDALDMTRSAEPTTWERRADELESQRATLNAWVEEVHKTRRIGCSVYDSVERLVAQGAAPAVTWSGGTTLGYDEAEVEAMRATVERVAAAAKAVDPPGEHVLAAARCTEWSPSLQRDLPECARASARATNALGASRRALARALETPDDGESREGLELVVALVKQLLTTPGPTLELVTRPGWADLCSSLEALLEAGRERDRLRTTLRQTLHDRALEEDVDRWERALSDAEHSFVLVRWFKVRTVRKEYAALRRQGATDVETMRREWDALRQLKVKGHALSQHADARQLFGARWNEGEADFDELAGVLEWVGAFRASGLRAEGHAGLRDSGWSRCKALATDERDRLEPGAPLRDTLDGFLAAYTAFEDARISLESLLSLTDDAWTPNEHETWLESVECVSEALAGEARSLRDWCAWQRSRQEAMEAGLDGLVRAFEDGTVARESLSAALERSFWSAWFNETTERSERLRRFHRDEHHRVLERFRALDSELLGLAQQVVRARVAARMPQVQADVSKRSEVGVLMRQLGLKRRHMPIRRLFEELPELLPRLKPCLLMSPLSVAQYLGSGGRPADLVVFDEASQIPVWDAIGALARGTEAVVVGDSKQLPPTRFFSRSADDDESADEAEIEELESILEECEAGGLPSMRLLWHYRSRHEALISFSNHHYYGRRLQTFPSPDASSERMGVFLHECPEGVYERGGTRTNRAEAEAVTAEVVRLLREGAGVSIGVVAFSQVQQSLIEDLLDAERRKHPELEAAFRDDADEPVFVKNLENVQGDERDVILFSVCYGPDEQGRVSLNFGPLNRVGGERRLNVAITRARRRVVLFSTLRPEHVDLNRTRAIGVAHLRNFLEYAARGADALSHEADSVRTSSSALVTAIHDALSERGYRAERSVGDANFRIDLALRDPEDADRFALGVMVDGPTYHATPTARDRDRIRGSVLAGLGWHLTHVWSVEWWLDPEREVARIEAAYQQALSDHRAAEQARAAAQPEAPPVAVSSPDAASPAAETAADPAAVSDAAAAADAATDADANAAADANADADADAGAAADAAAAATAATAADADAAPTHPPQKRATPQPPPQRPTFPLPPSAGSRGDPDTFEQDLAAVAAALLAEVDVAAPLTRDSLARRVALSFAVTKLTAKVRRQVEAAWDSLESSSRPPVVDDVVWRREDDPDAYDQVRAPHPDDEDPRAAEEIPRVELANAAKEVLQSQISLPMEDLQRETARKFGIGRLGRRVEQVTRDAVEWLAERGGCRMRDGQVVVAD